ncbi:classical arabinogalactan protein 26-like [Salvia hispanica]|uniref:classical arabinogalactan protein 26-like n=1 Tax=Salvia hispanica TaxID=49212 RepID=UPI002009CDA0|nr:classical arabinogalactan protein 26-like [Salvia hispanica]
MSSLNFLAAAITTTFIVSSTSALSPYTELPPDIAPLLPSTGARGATPPTGAVEPTIPSTHSPPNPDITGSTGLDTAFGPSGPLQDSFAVPQVGVRVLGAFGLLLYLIIIRGI